MSKQSDKKAFKKIKNFARNCAKNLTNNATPAELHIKKILDDNKINYKFQHILPSGKSFYVVDFLFPDSKIVLELDGWHHKHHLKREDKRRSHKILKRYHFFVARLYNDEALKMDYYSLVDFIMGFTENKHGV